MPSIKMLFSTPKKAAVTVLCLLIVLGMTVTGIVYVVNANSPAENSSIGGENAQNFAFADAGVDPAEAQAIQVEFERYQGEFVYEVEFIAGDTEYEYKINAADGSVVKKESKTVKGPESSGLPLSSAITLEEAQEIALADAGVGREQATFTGAEEDDEGGVPVWEFKFYTGNVEYEYEINAQTGAVYSKKTTTYVAQNPGMTASAAPQGSAPAQQAGSAPTAKPTQPPASSQPQPTAEPTQQPPAAAPSPQPTPQPSQQGGSLYIGSEAAKSAALANAGVSADQARFTKIQMDYEDGVAVYEIEFRTSTHEYEYEINAQTGAVRSKDIEALPGSSGGHHSDDYHSDQSQTGGDSVIGTERAKSAALGHAGLSAGEVQFTKAELDHEDGRAVYEIEFRKGGMEYEYEIDAATGAVLKYEIERD